MRVLLIGNTGQLGWELERTIAPLAELVALDYPKIDLSGESSIRRTIREHGRFHLIINAAAYTAVDHAESEKSLAEAVNSNGPRILAEEAREMGAAFIHYSTDYVFDGNKGSPYIESDKPNPLGVYGATKLAGESAVEQVGGAYLILRTAWVYSLRGNSFVTKVMRWSREQRTMRIVSDQVSNPTWARSLAEATTRIISEGMNEIQAWISDRTGLYHLAGDGHASRFEWAEEILKMDPERSNQAVRQVLPIKTDDFPTPAKRPHFSALDCRKFEERFGFRLPSWIDDLLCALRVTN
jgi:dTDP-4-dehydrorhamnose reductase